RNHSAGAQCGNRGGDGCTHRSGFCCGLFHRRFLFRGGFLRRLLRGCFAGCCFLRRGFFRCCLFRRSRFLRGGFCRELAFAETTAFLRRRREQLGAFGFGQRRRLAIFRNACVLLA